MAKLGYQAALACRPHPTKPIRTGASAIPAITLRPSMRPIVPLAIGSRPLRPHTPATSRRRSCPSRTGAPRPGRPTMLLRGQAPWPPAWQHTANRRRWDRNSLPAAGSTVAGRHPSAGAMTGLPQESARISEAGSHCIRERQGYDIGCSHDERNIRNSAPGRRRGGRSADAARPAGEWPPETPVGGRSHRRSPATSRHPAGAESSPSGAPTPCRAGGHQKNP